MEMGNRLRARWEAGSATALLFFASPFSHALTQTARSGDAESIAAALSRARSGDTVRIPRGEYHLIGAIVPPSGVHLLGDGPNRTILRVAPAFRDTAMIDLSDRHDIRVSSMSLDAGGHPRITRSIFARRAVRLRIDNMTFHDVGSNSLGIHFTGDAPNRANGVSDSVIDGCRFERMGVGSEWGGAIRLSWGSSRNRVLRNSIRDTGRGGIFADNGSCDLILRGNTVRGSGGEGLGLEVWGDCDRCVIEDNRLDHWLSVGGCSRCAVRRNRIGDRPQDAKFIGIEMIGSDSVLTDNTVDGGQQIGVSVSNNFSNRRVFWGYNRVERCIQWGAQLQGDATGVFDHYFYRCMFRSNGAPGGVPIYPNDAGHGFRINQNARRLVLDECEITGNRGLGVQVHGSEPYPSDDLAFLRCAIRKNGGAAASIWGGYRSLEWTGCEVAGNADDRLPSERGGAMEPAGLEIESPATIRAGKPVKFSARWKRRDGTRTTVEEPGSDPAVETGVIPSPSAGEEPAVLWDFGDGIPETSSEPVHVFPGAGRYRVTLVAWGGPGRASLHRSAHRVKWVRVR